MPSKAVSGMLGEAEKLPSPSAMAQQLYPSTGTEQTVAWRLHRVVGVAPNNVDEAEYEEWLGNFILSNSDNEDGNVNEVTVPQLRKMLQNPPAGWEAEFFKQAYAVALRTHADRVAFTTLEGVA